MLNAFNTVRGMWPPTAMLDLTLQVTVAAKLIALLSIPERITDALAIVVHYGILSTFQAIAN
jgi:hypothetical protein